MRAATVLMAATIYLIVHPKEGFRQSLYRRKRKLLEFTVMKTVDSHCQTFQRALEVLGKPWCALILNSLQGGPFRFTELRERTNGPGDKVLSGRLKELEARGLVLRRVDPGPPVRVAYELTASGRAFNDVACAIERWGRGLQPVKRPARKSRRTAPAG